MTDEPFIRLKRSIQDELEEQYAELQDANRPATLGDYGVPASNPKPVKPDIDQAIKEDNSKQALLDGGFQEDLMWQTDGAADAAYEKAQARYDALHPYRQQLTGYSKLGPYPRGAPLYIRNDWLRKAYRRLNDEFFRWRAREIRLTGHDPWDDLV